MKSFDALKRELAIVDLLDCVQVALACYWAALHDSLGDDSGKLISQLKAEEDSVLLSQARLQLEKLPTVDLCRMTDGSVAGENLRREFGDGYLDKLADKVEALFRHALSPA